MSIFGGGHKSAAKTPNKALGIDFQGAQYGPPIPVVYGQNKVAGNCIWYGDFQAIAVQQKQSGGKGGGGSSSTTSYDYKASYQLGICEGPGNIVNVYNGTSTVSLASLGAVVATGTQGQAPWAHLTGNYALGYSGTVLVSFQNRDLGSSASLPNDNFEVAGLKQFGSGIVDANPADILTDICTDPYHGINFGQLGSLTQYSNYCVAAGIFLSPVFDQQQTAQQALSDLLKYTNADAWFSEGVLKIGCYADESITGNGVTYTPNVTAVANLGPNDFITNGAEAPVTITRKSPADAMNIERLEYVDRANTYHTSAVTATIDNDVVKSGARSDQSDTYHGITTAAVARLVVQNILQRKYYVRNQYEFQLSWRYCYLEPFDIVTLTDVNTGLESFPVRILSVEEDEHGLLKLTAEEFPSGIGHGGTYGTQANGGATVDPNSDPGPVAAPYLFRGPGFLVSNNKPEIWCAVTGNGNALWAGCDVYLSHDGTSYTFLSTYARQARYGELTNSMGVQADPDTTSAPNVVLNGYNAQLLGGSQADADNFVTLAMIDSEIVSYETATLASGPSYNLSYLRRGGYGSTIAEHSAGAPFVRLDDGILRLPIDPSLIGQTVYLKFLSRNCFGRTPRTLAEETAYTYVVGTNVELPDVPNVPDNFAVTAVADGVQITWTNDNPAAVGCTSIEYATASGGPFSVLAQVGPTTTGFHHAFTTGSTYYYRARARGPLVQSGWSAYTSVLSSAGKTVQNGATNGATIGPGGNVNGAVDGNGRAIIDFGQGVHLNKILDNIGDGAEYYRMPGANMDGNRRALIDATQAGHVGAWNLDSRVADGTTYARPLASRLQNGVPLMSPTGRNMVVNGGWELNNVGTPLNTVLAANAPCGDGWIATANQWLPQLQTGDHNSGAQSACFAIGNGAVIPTGTTYGVVQSADTIPVHPGETLYLGVYFFWNSNYAMPAGVAISLNARLVFLDTNGNQLSSLYAGTALAQGFNNFGGTPLTSTGVVPSNASKAYFQYYIQTDNTSGSAVTIPAGNNYPVVGYCDDLFCYALTNLDTDAQDGTVNGRMAMADVYNVGGANRVGLRVAGSGHTIGDQRNLVSSITRNSGLVRSATALTANTGGSVNVNAHTITLGAASINYNAVTNAVTGLTTGAGYYIYTHDNYAGGTQTWNANGNANTVNSYDDAYNAGYVTIPSSGSSGGGGAGGGGGGTCVCADMYLRAGLTARDLAERWRWWKPWLWFLRGREGWHLIRRRPRIVQELCTRVTVADGSHIDCSVSTPITTQTGESVQAPMVYGRMMWTDAGWQRVIECEFLPGERDVVRICVGGHSFLAGADPYRRLDTHNVWKP